MKQVIGDMFKESAMSHEQPLTGASPKHILKWEPVTVDGQKSHMILLDDGESKRDYGTYHRLQLTHFSLQAL